jgi:mRNA interferase HigB
MHVISKKRIKEAQDRFPDCATALTGFYQIIANNDFTNFAELKKTFNHIDKVEHKYVFDIGGNKLRLIASIHFNRKKFYIRNVLSHKEYDKGQWKL